MKTIKEEIDELEKKVYKISVLTNELWQEIHELNYITKKEE